VDIVTAVSVSGWWRAVGRYAHVLGISARLAGAAACGAVWGGPLELVGVTPLVFALWWRANTRAEACALGLVYHALGARCLATGAARFLQISPIWAWFILVACVLPLALAWGAWWCAPSARESRTRVLLRAAGLFVTSNVPPLGALSVANPLVAAGFWLPGFGWVGLLLFVVVVAELRARAWIGVVFACASLAWGGHVTRTDDVGAVITKEDAAHSMLDFFQQWKVASSSLNAGRGSDAPIVVLPESAAGTWQGPMQRLWRAWATELRRERRAAVIGAALPRDDGDYDNGAVVIGAVDAVYRQRVPVPVAMWRPWEAGGFHAHLFGSGTVDVAGRRLGVLVCYETGLAWTALRSVAQGAEVLVGLSNGAWLRGTGALQAQRQSLVGWGALFALPVVLARNE